MAAILLFALLLSLTGCGHDEYAESDMLPAYLVSVTAGEANGSGILYQKDQHWLYVLTAAHVVSGMEPGGQAALRFRDGWEISANNISASATTDIALIRIPLDEIPDEREESYQCVESDKDSFDRLLIGDACTAVGLARDGGELENIRAFDGRLVAVPERFYYLTSHRQENTDRDEKLDQIFQAAEELDAPVVYHVHPRNHERAARLCRANGYRNIILTAPVGYKTSISLVNRAEKIVTDSGGLQREAFFAQKPCVTICDYVSWPETMVNRCNQLAKPEKADILEKLGVPVRFDPAYQPFGDGHAAEKIVEAVRQFLA